MQGGDESSPAGTAATDEVFREGSPVAAVPMPPAGGPAPARESDVQPAKPDPVVLLLPADAAPEEPPGDYVRALGQEYQDQQEEGRL